MKPVVGGRTTLDWQIGDSEDWESFVPLNVPFEHVTSPELGVTGRRWRPGNGLRNLLLGTLLATMVLGYSIVADYQANIARVHRDIQSTIDLEAWAWQSNDDALTERLLDDQADRGWSRYFQLDRQRSRRRAGAEVRPAITQIQSIDLVKDLAMVDVLVTQPPEPWAASPYRETRFYRQAGGQWLRTSPDASFWGLPDTITTDHFRFDFYQHDAEAVRTVASEIDAAYGALRRDMGLGPPPADEKLRVRIVPRVNVMYWRFSGNELVVPSPALLQVPVEYPDSARLMRSIIHPLAGRLIEEVAQQIRINYNWYLMVEGVRLWVGWDNNVAPSSWFYYADGLMRRRLEAGRLPTLNEIIALGTERWDDVRAWLGIMLAQAAVEFAVTTYGRDRVPALLQGFSEYKTWDELVPAVFGVPAGEFEAGWQAYLSQRHSLESHVAGPHPRLAAAAIEGR